jgi:hypothetical protein
MIIATCIFIAFSLFMGLLGYLMFTRQEIFIGQFLALLVMTLLPLLLNIGNFYMFHVRIRPLIPCEHYDGNYEWYVGIQAGGIILSVCAIGMILGSLFGIMTSNKFSRLIKTLPFPKAATISSEGRTSILTCPGCQSLLPVRWILLSGMKTEYSCTQCGAVLVWTRRRSFLFLIINMSAAPLIITSKVLLDMYWPGISAFIVVGTFLAVCVPGQYRLKKDQQ